MNFGNSILGIAISIALLWAVVIERGCRKKPVTVMKP